jgi:hypothetical protein
MQWVRNAEVADEVRLRKGRQVLEFRLRALPETERPPLLNAYLERYRPMVQQFFPVPVGSLVEAFTALAHCYPVFELQTKAQG